MFDWIVRTCSRLLELHIPTHGNYATLNDFSLNHLRNIKSLTLCSVDAIDIATLLPSNLLLPNLQELCLIGYQFTPFQPLPAHLDCFPRVEQLMLTGCLIDRPELSFLITQMKNTLRSVAFHGTCSIWDKFDCLLSALDPISRTLESLSILGYASVSVRCLTARLSQFPKLRKFEHDEGLSRKLWAPPTTTRLTFNSRNLGMWEVVRRIAVWLSDHPHSLRQVQELCLVASLQDIEDIAMWRILIFCLMERCKRRRLNLHVELVPEWTWSQSNPVYYYWPKAKFLRAMQPSITSFHNLRGLN